MESRFSLSCAITDLRDDYTAQLCDSTGTVYGSATKYDVLYNESTKSGTQDYDTSEHSEAFSPALDGTIPPAHTDINFSITKVRENEYRFAMPYADVRYSVVLTGVGETGISIASAEDSQIQVNVQNLPQNASLYLGQYDDSGSLIGSSIEPIAAQTTSITLEFSKPETASTVRGFLLNAQFAPLSPSVETVLTPP